MTEANDRDRWPGVLTAYDWIAASYDWSIRRHDAMENRIQAVQALALSLLVVITAITDPQRKELLEPTFLGAILTLAFLVGFGIYAQNAGHLLLIGTQQLYQSSWLRSLDWEFKKDLLYRAKEHENKNLRSLYRKDALLNCMVVLLLLEVALLVLWVGVL